LEAKNTVPQKPLDWLRGIQAWTNQNAPYHRDSPTVVLTKGVAFISFVDKTQKGAPIHK